MSYLSHLIVLASVYALLAMSLNVIVGFAGMMSLCHAAFFGIGAYASTLLVMAAGWPFVPAAIAAALFCGLLGAALALPIIRLRGDSFILATLAFQVIALAVFSNWTEVTGGTFGIGNIPAPNLFGVSIDTPFRYAIFGSATTSLGGLVFALMIDSPFGRTLRAIREDEVAAAALGKDVNRIKSMAFIVSAAGASIGGALQAGYARYIDPTGFTLTEGILVLSMVIIGGAGSLLGPVIGALLTIAIPEALRFLDVPTAVAGNVRQIMYGAAIVILMRTRPRGIIGAIGSLDDTDRPSSQVAPSVRITP